MRTMTAIAALLGALVLSLPAAAQNIERIRPQFSLMEHLASKNMFVLRLEHAEELVDGRFCMAFSEYDARVWCPRTGFVLVGTGLSWFNFR